MVRALSAAIASILGAALVCHCSSGRDYAEGGPPTTFGEGGAAEASMEAGPACVAITLGTDHRPLDLFIMMDTSGSMFGVPWRQAKEALTDFFENPGATSVATALNYFPSPGDHCDEEYYKLFSVGLGPLPSHAPALETSLAAITPFGGTPLSAAIDGALFAAIAQKKAQPDHAVAALIVTDGAPTECGSDLAPTLEIVRAALVEEGVPTFAIGIGDDASLVLDPIAMAGGSGHSLTVADPSALAEKIREAQTIAVGCEFVIPKTSADGQVVDPELVNVSFASGTNPSHVVRSVGSLGACGTAEGWYYDDPKSPKAVRLCPNSCALLNSTASPRVDVNFGCATVFH